LCLQAVVTPNLVSDAWIAASVLQLGEVIHTFDRDFKKLLPADNLHLLSR
jgi:predicted nucleic acid-binding protein